jgi:hypothetical protein
MSQVQTVSGDSRNFSERHKTGFSGASSSLSFSLPKSILVRFPHVFVSLIGDCSPTFLSQWTLRTICSNNGEMLKAKKVRVFWVRIIRYFHLVIEKLQTTANGEISKPKLIELRMADFPGDTSRASCRTDQTLANRVAPPKSLSEARSDRRLWNRSYPRLDAAIRWPRNLATIWIWTIVFLSWILCNLNIIIRKSEIVLFSTWVPNGFWLFNWNKFRRMESPWRLSDWDTNKRFGTFP